MEFLLNQIDEKLKQQTVTITTSVTESVMGMIEEKMRMITEENSILKTKVTQLEQKIITLQNEKRKNNLVFFGVEELGKTESELVDYIKDLIIETGTYFSSQEISNVYRIGQRTNNKNRPVIATITTLWKKHQILKNKTKLPPGIYIKEDYSREVLEKRKQLQLTVEEEKQRGNIAFLKHDKLVVIKPKDSSREKRKRQESTSPNSLNQKKATTASDSVQTTKIGTKEIIRPNILNYVEKGRTSTLGTPKN